MAGNQLPNLERIFRDEDEPDFLPSGGSNLAAIFGLQGKMQDTQPSAKQTQKKASSVYSTQPTSVNKPELIIATAIYAYKLQGGSYGPVGKLGLALTRDITTRTYQIILYKTKQEHVSVVTVTRDFVYSIQENNYCSYYDTAKDNWTILFESNEARDEFAREIGLARYLSKEGKIDNVLYQDLTPVSKKEVAKEGDKIHIKYFVATEIVQPFKNNSVAPQTMTVEISTDDNWERILLGADKGLKRLLFLPPSKQISLGPGFPKEKDVMMEIEVVDIVADAKTGVKASIIQRMAKMGQSMLPKPPTSTTTDSEDTEDDVPHKSPRHKKGDALGVVIQKKNMVHDSKEETQRTVHKIAKSKVDLPPSETNSPKPLIPAAFAPSHQWSPTQIQSNYITMDGQVYSLQPQPMAQTIPTVMDPSLNMFLSESRMASAELRMGMSKIADNVQKLLDKFHVLELQNASTPGTEKVAMDATLKMLLAMNTQSGTKEIELRKSGEQNSNVSDDSSLELNEMRNNVSTLEKELKELRESLASSKEYIKDLEAERESLKFINKKSQVEIERLENSLVNANDMLQKTKEELEHVMLQNSHYEKKNAAMEEKMSKLLQEHSALE